MAPTLTARQLKNFWDKVGKSPEHWIWTGALIPDRKGGGIAGQFSIIHEDGTRRPTNPRRIIWMLSGHDWPDGDVIMACSERRCVAPSHMTDKLSEERATRRLARGTSVLLTCQGCGIQFVRATVHSGRNATHFHSRECFLANRELTIEETFNRRVIRHAEGCWGWRRRSKRGDYGMIRGIPAHRLSYEIHVGPIPEGMIVRHICDNPPCTRPDHLLVGTAADNVADMIERERDNPGGRRMLLSLIALLIIRLAELESSSLRPG
jgi:hypothetical protein